MGRTKNLELQGLKAASDKRVADEECQLWKLKVNPDRNATLTCKDGDGQPADFGKFIADETEQWAKVIRAANIRA